MAIWMWVLLIIIICQRLGELIIAKKNERWLKERGGVENGEEHYKWFILLHISFFLCLLIETMVNYKVDYSINHILMAVFILTQIGRVWCIYSLGRFWNTKIITLPGTNLIKKGPYKYMKHPNYVIVGIELFIIPFMFGAYLTAFIFPILHVLLLRIRIPQEEEALVTSIT